MHSYAGLCWFQTHMAATRIAQRPNPDVASLAVIALAEVRAKNPNLASTWLRVKAIKLLKDVAEISVWEALVYIDKLWDL